MKYWFLSLLSGMLIIIGAFILLLIGLMPLRLSTNEALLLGFGLIIGGWVMSIWFSPIGRKW